MAMFGGHQGPGMDTGDYLRARHRDLLREQGHLDEARRLGFKTHSWTRLLLGIGGAVVALLLLSFIAFALTR